MPCRASSLTGGTHCAQRRVHFGDGIQRLCIVQLIAGGIGIIAVFGAVGVKRFGQALVVG
jgi:hypothetical protein